MNATQQIIIRRKRNSPAGLSVVGIVQVEDGKWMGVNVYGKIISERDYQTFVNETSKASKKETAQFLEMAQKANNSHYQVRS